MFTKQLFDRQLFPAWQQEPPGPSDDMRKTWTNLNTTLHGHPTFNDGILISWGPIKPYGLGLMSLSPMEMSWELIDPIALWIAFDAFVIVNLD